MGDSNEPPIGDKLNVGPAGSKASARARSRRTTGGTNGRHADSNGSTPRSGHAEFEPTGPQVQPPRDEVSPPDALNLDDISVEETAARPDDDQGGDFFTNLLGSLTGSVSSAPKPKTSAKQKAAQFQADMTLGLASGMVQGFVGEEAGINQVEHYLISTGLADVIANEPLAMKAATKIPLVALLAGLGFWASRCVTIWRDKHPARSRKPAPPTVVQPAASMTPTVENTVPMYERRDPEFTTEPIVGDAWGLPTAVDTPDWYRESQRASFREDNAGLEAIDTNADQDR